MENNPKSPVTKNPVTDNPATNAPAVESATKPEKKKPKIWLIVLIVIVLFLLCACISVAVILIKNIPTDITDILIPSEVSDTEQVEETDESSQLTEEWVDVYSESGTGSKDTKIFQIDGVNNNGWKIIYTFEGSSDTSTLCIETFTPPLAYGDDVVEYVYENGEVILETDNTGPYYLGIETDEDSSWTIEVKQLMSDSIVTNTLDDSTGEWVDILSDEGTGSHDTKVFQIEEDNSKGWEIAYTFKGDLDTSTFYIERVAPGFAYGTDIVEYVYEDGTAILDETITGSYYLRIRTDDNSSWTIEIRQLLD